MAEEINFPSWQKLDLRVGKIIKAEDIPGVDKLYRLEVDLGKEIGKRVLVAGIKKYYQKKELNGKKVIVFCNLEPRVMKGVKSEGMILAAVNEDESKIRLIQPKLEVKEGTKIEFKNG